MDLRNTMRRILLANELGGNAELAYRFTDPDGPRGRSGYSFGICQFDLSHNRHAIGFLYNCGFSVKEIASLQDQTCNLTDLASLNRRLKTMASAVDIHDAEEIDKICSHVLSVIGNRKLGLDGEEAFFHLCDYHNQYSLDYDGKAVRHFQPFGRPITAQDVLDYKLSTAWGQKRPDDVRRRWNNIHRICGEIT